MDNSKESANTVEVSTQLTPPTQYPVTVIKQLEFKVANEEDWKYLQLDVSFKQDLSVTFEDTFNLDLRSVDGISVE